MTDNSQNRGEPDRSLINVNQDHEVRYWTKELGVTEQQLREAVKAVLRRALQLELDTRVPNLAGVAFGRESDIDAVVVNFKLASVEPGLCGESADVREAKLL